MRLKGLRTEALRGDSKSLMGILKGKGGMREIRLYHRYRGLRGAWRHQGRRWRREEIWRFWERYATAGHM